MKRLLSISPFSTLGFLARLVFSASDRVPFFTEMGAASWPEVEVGGAK